MALRPSHAAPQFAASEVFTDRVEARAAFADAFEQPQAPDEYRILTWYGVGGQGKSALQDEFGRMVERRREAWINTKKRKVGGALLNLELIEQRSPVQAMLTIRLQLGDSAGIAFPAFDTAFARYFTLENPGKDIRAVHPQLFKSGGDVLGDVLQLADGVAGTVVPGYSLLSKYGAQLLARGAERLHRWWSVRGLQVLNGLDELGQDALASRLPSYLGADLCDAMAGENPPRLAIRVDTHEALWRERGIKDGPGALLADDWLRLLVQDAPGVLFVITGRDRLRWGEIEPDWDTVMTQEPLGGLSRQDAGLFLEKVGVDDAAVRAVIVEAALKGDEDASGGCLPYYLELERNSWHAIKGAGRTPGPEDFGGTRAQILARFLNHLDDTTEQMLRMASYPQALETAGLDVVAGVLAPGQRPEWGRLLSRSFVAREEGQAPTLHLLMREALQAHEREAHGGRWEQTHRALFDHFAAAVGNDPKALTEADEQAFLAALRHLIPIAPEEALEWGSGRVEMFDIAARYRTVEAAALLLATAAAKAGDEEAQARTGLEYAGALRAMGRLAEAEAAIAAVRDQIAARFGETHMLFADALVEASRLAEFAEDPGGAQPWLIQALAIHDAARVQDWRTAELLGVLASVEEKQERYEQAQGHLERALAILEAGPDGPRTGTLRRVLRGYLANVAARLGRHAEAESIYLRLVDEVRAAHGEEHPEYAAMLNNLAWVYAAMDQQARGRALMEEALRVVTTHLGPRHHLVATCLSNLGSILQFENDHSTAEGLYLQALDIRREAYGPDHADVAATMDNLATTLKHLGRPEEAMAMRREVLVMLAGARVPDHEKMAGAERSLAVDLAQMGEMEAAEDHYRRSIEAARKPRSSEGLGLSLLGLGSFYQGQERHAEASACFEDAVEAYGRSKGPDHHMTFTARTGLAMSLLYQRRLEEALPQFEWLVAHADRTGAPRGRTEMQLMEMLAQLYQHQGQAVQAAELADRLEALKGGAGDAAEAEPPTVH